MPKSKILFLGNIHNNSGPSIVNRNLYENLNGQVQFIESKQKLKKLITFFRCIFVSKVVVCSGIGILNVLGAIISRILGGQVVYIMHGAIKLEMEYKSYSYSMRCMEKLLLKASCRIVCVSDFYLDKLSKMEPYLNYTNKMLCILNGYDCSELSKYNDVQKKVSCSLRKVITVGGGRSEKNIIGLCRAIELLNDSSNVKLTVVGPDGPDTNLIRSYPFVRYVGSIPQKELFNLYQQHDVFVQFSYLESFGLAPIEAVQYGCSLVVSDQVGISKYLPASCIVPLDDMTKLGDAIFRDNNLEVTKELSKNLITWEESSLQHYNLWCSVWKPI